MDTIKQKHFKEVILPYATKELMHFQACYKQAMNKFRKPTNFQEIIDNIIPRAVMLASGGDSNLLNLYMNILINALNQNNSYLNDETLITAIPYATYVFVKFKKDYNAFLDKEDFEWIIEFTKGTINMLNDNKQQSQPNRTKKSIRAERNLILINGMKERGIDRQLGTIRFNALVDYATQTIDEIESAYYTIINKHNLNIEVQRDFWKLILKLYEALEGYKYVEYNTFIELLRQKISQFSDQLKSAEDALLLFYHIFMITKAHSKFGSNLSQLEGTIILQFLVNT